MVEVDLIGRGITDDAVLEAMRTVPRERFVGENDLDEAYADRPLPIGCDQTISQPYIVALMTELLRVRPTDRVLDIGTGSGYAAAVLATIADEVWSVEREPHLAHSAARRLSELGFERVHVEVGDGSLGWPPAAPFDAISVAAAATSVPPALVEQLADGGRLVIPVERSRHHQELLLIERDGSDIVERDVVPVRFVPLVTDHD
ncbi:MAG: protein-L-isoaspartate(D-aspartate) O-methyltransferase [Ilumatobacter sp.]|nr:MAG: protein-L-isoaspartate(D-aspartate) O-methyltransferase [Ilumatobacter sp.]